MSVALFDLTGKRALITGSSQGIGFALAKGMAAAGAQIVLNGRDVAKLEAAQTTLRDQGFSVDTLAFDATNHAMVRSAIDEFEASVGAILGLKAPTKKR